MATASQGHTSCSPRLRAVRLATSLSVIIEGQSENAERHGDHECERHCGRAAIHRQSARRRLSRQNYGERQWRAWVVRFGQHAAPMTVLEPHRLGLADLARIASVGIRTRRIRASLSALGIAIGVAAIVAVLGLSASSQAGLLAEIDKLGTNLLTVQNGQTTLRR